MSPNESAPLFRSAAQNTYSSVTGAIAKDGNGNLSWQRTLTKYLGCVLKVNGCDMFDF